MLKKTITYTDFDGNNRTEDLYFNLTKNELVDIALDMPDDTTEAIGANPDNVNVEEAGSKLLARLGKAGIVKFIKDLVHKAYGIKSEDGRRFIKTEALTTEFTQTLAYDEFIMSLLSSDEEAAAFINGVIPADAMKQANKPNALPIK